MDILTLVSMDKSVAGKKELADSIKEAYDCGALWEIKKMSYDKLKTMKDEIQRKTFHTHVDDILITIFEKEIEIKSNQLN